MSSWSLYDLLSHVNNRTPIKHPASKLIEESAKKDTFSVIQGPPGTGKSTAIDNAIINLFNNTEFPILYVAPTNKLVHERAIKLISYLINYVKKREDIPKIMRIYGSAFVYDKAENFRKPVDDEVRIILSTEYQRSYVESEEVRDIVVIVDEASKSPIARPFITLARSIINGNARVQSLTVIGDPQQAISKDAGMTTTELLFTFMVKQGLLRDGILNQGQKNIDADDILAKARSAKPKWFTFLDETYRMPKYSEEPCSLGYYGGELKSNVNFENRIKNNIDLDKLKKLRGKSKYVNLPDFDKVLDAVENAITSEQPVIYNEYSGLSYSEHNILRIDKKRATISMYYATILAYITLGNAAQVYIQTAYTDQKTYIMMNLDRMFSKLPRDVIDDVKYKIRVSTSHERIGDESLFTVNVLGKEWYGHGTLYYQEPEVLNVANSRHQGLNVIVGNLKKLRDDAAKKDKELRTKKFRKLIDFSEKVIDNADDEKFLILKLDKKNAKSET